MSIFIDKHELAEKKDVNAIKSSMIPLNIASTNENLYDDRFKNSPQMRSYIGDAANTIQENPFGMGVWFFALYFVINGGGNLIVIDTYNHIKIKALNHGDYDKKWTVISTTAESGGK